MLSFSPNQRMNIVQIIHGIERKLIETRKLEIKDNQEIII